MSVERARLAAGQHEQEPGAARASREDKREHPGRDGAPHPPHHVRAGTLRRTIRGPREGPADRALPRAS